VLGNDDYVIVYRSLVLLLPLVALCLFMSARVARPAGELPAADVLAVEPGV
jgi:hypothetical protein